MSTGRTGPPRLLGGHGGPVRF